MARPALTFRGREPLLKREKHLHDHDHIHFPYEWKAVPFVTHHSHEHQHVDHRHENHPHSNEDGMALSYVKPTSFLWKRSMFDAQAKNEGWRGASQYDRKNFEPC